jgi:hypothetical protein
MAGESRIQIIVSGERPAGQPEEKASAPRQDEQRRQQTQAEERAKIAERARMADQPSREREAVRSQVAGDERMEKALQAIFVDFTDRLKKIFDDFLAGTQRTNREDFAAKEKQKSGVAPEAREAARKEAVISEEAESRRRKKAADKDKEDSSKSEKAAAPEMTQLERMVDMWLRRRLYYMFRGAGGAGAIREMMDLPREGPIFPELKKRYQEGGIAGLIPKNVRESEAGEMISSAFAGGKTGLAIGIGMVVAQQMTRVVVEFKNFMVAEREARERSQIQFIGGDVIGARATQLQRNIERYEHPLVTTATLGLSRIDAANERERLRALEQTEQKKQTISDRIDELAEFDPKLARAKALAERDEILMKLREARLAGTSRGPELIEAVAFEKRFRSQATLNRMLNEMPEEINRRRPLRLDMTPEEYGKQLEDQIGVNPFKEGMPEGARESTIGPWTEAGAGIIGRVAGQFIGGTSGGFAGEQFGKQLAHRALDKVPTAEEKAKDEAKSMIRDAIKEAMQDMLNKQGRKPIVDHLWDQQSPDKKFGEEQKKKSDGNPANAGLNPLGNMLGMLGLQGL